MPGVLAPALSDIFNGGQRDLAWSYFTKVSGQSKFPASTTLAFLDDQRALVESSVAATVAFLASAAELIPPEIPASCFPAPSVLDPPPAARPEE